MPPTVPGGRAGALIQHLSLAPHPEGGWYREVFRSVQPVARSAGAPARVAMTSIDFVLGPGERSAWHRVRSDEAWHLLEAGPLLLWLMPPDFSRTERVVLGPVAAALPGQPAGTSGQQPRHVVPAGWWQAAEPLADWAYVGATVAPGFEFADFSFGRDDSGFCAALARLAPELQRLV